MKINAPHLDVMRTSPLAYVREAIRDGRLEVKVDGVRIDPSLLDTRLGDESRIIITHARHGDIGEAVIRVSENDGQHKDEHEI